MTTLRRSALGWPVAIALLILASRCEPQPACPDPQAVAVLGPELPAWAIGTFSRFDIDVFNLQVNADGGFFLSHNGGDVGGCGAGSAWLEDGGVHLGFPPSAGNAPPPPDAVLISTADGGFFIGGRARDRFGGSLGERSCGWVEYRPGTVCGVGGGGCGGFSSTRSCAVGAAMANCARLADGGR